MKSKTIKPTNKMRDEAISHVLGKSTVLENMIESLAISIDILIDFIGQEFKQEDFKAKYRAYCVELEKERIKKRDEQKIQKADGESVEENTEDEGRGSEGIREDK